jgi:lipopolysaccharide/colanic/teichoic acid biosynthesis glycosyltransferase
VLLVPFGIIAILIRFDSPGPVLFRQPRICYRNQVFLIWKFRTMYADRTDINGSHGSWCGGIAGVASATITPHDWLAVATARSRLRL